jgi:pimeloyl-ACP methyl ester carboxylesterase
MITTYQTYIMPNTKTVDVSHLGGITAAYQTSGNIDKAKPTLILVNSFTTSSELYHDAYSNEQLTSVMNLIAIELLGHGQTRAHKAKNWTYWDTAIMNLQVMEKLGIEKAFVLGTSQGGWITVRMALMGPEKVSSTCQQRLSRRTKDTCITSGLDPRHNPPRHIPRLRIRTHPLPRMLASPNPTRKIYPRRIQQQDAYPRLPPQ